MLDKLGLAPAQKLAFRGPAVDLAYRAPAYCAAVRPDAALLRA
jgi:hypothetical protein